MLRNLISIARKFNPSIQEEIAALRRRNAFLVQESLEMASYINFLTGKCVTFECATLVRQAERGELVK